MRRRGGWVPPRRFGVDRPQSSQNFRSHRSGGNTIARALGPKRRSHDDGHGDGRRHRDSPVAIESVRSLAHLNLAVGAVTRKTIFAGNTSTPDPSTRKPHDARVPPPGPVHPVCDRGRPPWGLPRTDFVLPMADQLHDVIDDLLGMHRIGDDRDRVERNIQVHILQVMNPDPS